MTASSPVRLVLDMFVLGQGVRSGVYRVCDELYPRLAENPAFATRFLLPPRHVEAARAYITARGLRGREHSAPPGRPSLDADVLLSPFNSPADEWAADEDVRHAHIIYDLIALRRPEFFSEHAVREVAGIIARLTPQTLVFAISEHTKRDLLAERPDLSPESVIVIPLAAANAFRPCADQARSAALRAQLKLPPGVPYALSLATLEVRKNLDLVVRAFVNLLDAEPRSNLHLVLAGMSGWKLEKLEAQLSSAGRWRDRIILPGYVADEDLPSLYSDALFFVYMSRYEGFGLPPLEAMACGTPVITADNSSLPEVVGDAGVMLDADDVDGLSQAMKRVADDPTLRREMSSRGLARASLFSWERCAEMVSRAILARQTDGRGSARSNRPAAGAAQRGTRSTGLVSALATRAEVPVLRGRHLAVLGVAGVAACAAFLWRAWPIGWRDFGAGVVAGAGVVFLVLLAVKKLWAMRS